jgi:hypothetical protein
MMSSKQQRTTNRIAFSERHLLEQNNKSSERRSAEYNEDDIEPQTSTTGRRLNFGATCRVPCVVVD